MTLPTIQPVDWPDWGVMPTTSVRNFNVTAIAAPSAVILEASVGYFSYAVLNVSADGDGESSQFAIEWYDAAQSEGPNLVGSITVERITLTNIVIPMAVWAPYLVLREIAATNYPHNMLGTLTLASQPPYQTGYPGGTHVINFGGTALGSAETLLIPNGCAPGPHQLFVVTTATDWALELWIYDSPSSRVVIPLADDTFALPVNVSFIGPASSWAVNFVNNDVGDASLIVTCHRNP